MESHGSVIRDDDGRIRRVLPASDDIAEKEQVEQQLRIAAAAFESHEGIVVTDAKSMILRINRAFSKMTGYAAEELVGRDLDFLVSASPDAPFLVAVRETTSKDGVWRGEIWNRTKSGEANLHRVTVSAVRDNAGNLTHYVGIYTDITEHKLREDQVHRLAFQDPLTQLPNRRLVTDRLNQAMAASKRSGRYGALIFFDLDNFKPLNDSHGHDVGDLLLIEAAKRLRSCVRETDTVARFGGDEFVVMLVDLDADKAQSISQAENVAGKIRRAFSKPYLLSIRHEGRPDISLQHRCTASIGIALFLGDQACEKDILKSADTAMYQAKGAGRNTIRLFDPRV